MSFFPFDTGGGQRPVSGAGQGIFEHKNPFTGIAQTRKLQAFQNKDDEVLDFEDTYDGLGDQLEETNDDFNDDTFGGDVAGGTSGQGAVGRDFDFFGNTAQVSNAIEEEHIRYNLGNRPRAAQQYSQPPAQAPKRSGYERYQDPGYIPEIEAKSNVWGTKPPQASTPDAPLINTARPGQAPSRKVMSLEEVEAAMRAQSQPPMYPQQPPMYAPPPQEPQVAPQGPSAQQFRQHEPPPTVQAQIQPPHAAAPKQRHGRNPSQQDHSKASQPPLQILQNPNRAKHSPQPSQDRTQAPSGPSTVPGSNQPLPVITNPQQLMDLSEEQRKAYLEEDAKRAKRNHKIFLLSKGNGLMTPQDKNFITRIQLQQLVSATGNSADPSPEAALAEDFYYQVYSQIRGAPRQHPTQPLGHFAQTYLFQTGGRMGGNRRNPVNGANHMQRMQQQVQRAVEAAKLKPKNKQLIIEGSLGKISFSNAKTPKPLLNIKRADSSDPRPASRLKQGDVASTSDRKTVLRNIEAVYTVLMQMEDHERQMPPPAVEGDADAIQAHLEWRRDMQKLNSQLWQDLKVLDPIVPGSLTMHPFIAFLSFAKGKKAIPRVFRHIDQEQRITILTMIVIHLDQLDVVSGARIAPGETQPPPAVREEIELFLHTVVESLHSYVNEAPMNIIIGILGLLIDHTNVVNVSKTRIGITILTMLLSRAEIAKHAGNISDDDLESWTSPFDRLFDVLEPVLDGIFPAPVNTGDDMYVWQFLAAVGAGASPEQQQRLVIGVKDRVMETVSQSKTLPPEMSSQRLGNVNLFMKAIGLDVALIAGKAVPLVDAASTESIRNRWRQTMRAPENLLLLPMQDIRSLKNEAEAPKG